MVFLYKPLLIGFLLATLQSAAATATTAATAATATTAPAPLPDLDVPFVVSAPVVTRTMLEMAKVSSSDYVVDLGSGDGRIVFLAARQYGARGLGVEIDQHLVETAQEDAQKLNLDHLVTFRKQDLFATDVAAATVITMYLLPDVNLALRPKLLGLKPGTRIVSHDWDMGDWLADETRTVDNPEKSLGREKLSRVYLWIVPATLAGKWCAQQAESNTAPAMNVELRLEQRYQKLDGALKATVATAATAATVAGNARGLNVQFRAQFRATLNARRFVIPHIDRASGMPAVANANGDTIVLDGEAYGEYGLASGLIFKRAGNADAVCESPSKRANHVAAPNQMG